MNIQKTAPELLAEFRTRHQSQTLTLFNHDWEILRGQAEGSFRLMQLFAPQYHVVSVSYPTTITSVQEMVEGLTAVIRHISPDQPIHLLGGSYGGLSTQALMRHAPDTVQTLILSHTGVPVPERAQKNKRFSIIIRLLPYKIVQNLFQRQIEQILPPLLDDRAFWHEYLTDSLNHIGKKDLLNRVKVSIDFDVNCDFTANDLAQWQGRILIIESDDDPMLSSFERQQLLDLYPQAITHTFEGTGHATSLLQPETYVTLIHQFLRQT